MRVLVIGASGYIGSVVCEKLKAAGYPVTGLARSENTREKLALLGYDTVPGDLTDTQSLKRAVKDCDSVIHLAGLHGDAGKMSNEEMLNLAEADRQSARAVIEGLAGTNKKFIHTTGATLFAEMSMGEPSELWHDEDADYQPPEFMQDRYLGERYLLGRGGEHDCNTTVIRPAIVYGRGAGLVVQAWLDLVDKLGISPYVGRGLNRVGMVHVDDLADLYLAALEHAGARTVFNAASEFISGGELASVHSLACGLEGKTTSWTTSWTWENIISKWPFLDAVLISVNELMTCEKAKKELGWKPRQPGYCVDVVSGSYAKHERSLA